MTDPEDSSADDPAIWYERDLPARVSLAIVQNTDRNET